MLKKKGSFFDKHILVSDSETESEDMSRFSKVQTPERHKKSKCTDGRGRKRGKGYGGNPG